MTDSSDPPSDRTLLDLRAAEPQRARCFRLSDGDTLVELDLFGIDDSDLLHGHPDLEVRLIAPGLRTRVVLPIPRARLLRFAAELIAVRAGSAPTATLHASGASVIWLRVRRTATGLGLSLHGRQYGTYTVRFLLRDLVLDADAFRQLLGWAAVPRT